MWNANVNKVGMKVSRNVVVTTKKTTNGSPFSCVAKYHRRWRKVWTFQTQNHTQVRAPTP